MKCPQDSLQEALRGRVTEHHRFLLGLHLGQIDELDAAIETMTAGRDQPRSLSCRRRTRQHLPGVSTLGAQAIISEIGTDMSRFPTAGHLAVLGGPVPA